MADVSFPSPWRIWTQSQREQMFLDYVTETCHQRGYTNAREWRTDVTVTGGPHDLSGHLETFLKKNRGRLDTYASTKTLAKLAAHHICPEGGSGSGSPSGGTPIRRPSHLMSALELLPAILFPWFIRPQVETASFSGLVFAEGSDPPDVASSPAYDFSDASPFGLDPSFTFLDGGGRMCGAMSIPFFPVVAAPAVP